MSFVSPAVIPDADFRERWASHEWENKIAVRRFFIIFFESRFFFFF
jgi:vesicle coat complex subunit